MPDLKETSEAYARHVPDTPPAAKPAMGTQGAEPGAADLATQAAHAADNLERATDFANRFPGAVAHMDERANFSRAELVAQNARPGETTGQTMARMKADAEAAAKGNAQGKGQATVTSSIHGDNMGSTNSPGRPAMKRYACGCSASAPYPATEADLPAECPTHSTAQKPAPSPTYDANLKPPTKEEVMDAGYPEEAADRIVAEENRKYATKEQPYGLNSPRMPGEWPKKETA